MLLLHSTHFIDTLVIILNFQDDGPENCLCTHRKWPFLNTKSAVERPRQLEMAQSLLHR